MRKLLPIIVGAALSQSALAGPADPESTEMARVLLLAQAEQQVVEDLQGKLTASQRELEVAEQQLAEAARRVAELSQTMHGQSFIFEHAGDSGARRGPVLGVSLSSNKTTVQRNGKNVTREDDAGKGPLISDVTPGSGADKGGLRQGDRLVAVDGVSLVSQSRGVPIGLISEALEDRKAGDTVTVEIDRDGKRLTRQVELSERATSSVKNVLSFRTDGRNAPLVIERLGMESGELHELQAMAPLLGGSDGHAFFFNGGQRWADMELVELSAGLGDYFGAKDGLLVVRAPSDETLGFEDGDVIRLIGDRKPESVGHALRILRSYEAGEQLTVELLRKRKNRKIDITLPE